MKINFATISKTGKRTNNEDAFCVIDGTVEVCDWICDAEQRVVFRENY